MDAHNSMKSYGEIVIKTRTPSSPATAPLQHRQPASCRAATSAAPCTAAANSHGHSPLRQEQPALSYRHVATPARHIPPSPATAPLQQPTSSYRRAATSAAPHPRRLLPLPPP